MYAGRGELGLYALCSLTPHRSISRFLDGVEYFCKGCLLSGTFRLAWL